MCRRWFDLCWHCPMSLSLDYVADAPTLGPFIMNHGAGMSSIMVGCYDVGMVFCSSMSYDFANKVLADINVYGVKGASVIIRTACGKIAGGEAALLLQSLL